MNIGYTRVSTTDQNLDRQIDQLKQAGCEQILKKKSLAQKKNVRNYFAYSIHYAQTIP